MTFSNTFKQRRHLWTITSRKNTIIQNFSKKWINWKQIEETEYNGAAIRFLTGTVKWQWRLDCRTHTHTLTHLAYYDKTQGLLLEQDQGRTGRGVSEEEQRGRLMSPAACLRRNALQLDYTLGRRRSRPWPSNRLNYTRPRKWRHNWQLSRKMFFVCFKQVLTYWTYRACFLLLAQFSTLNLNHTLPTMHCG